MAEAESTISVLEAIMNIVSDPLSILLIAVGGLLVTFTVALTGYLAAGAAVDFVTPDSSQEPPQRAG